MCDSIIGVQNCLDEYANNLFFEEKQLWSYNFWYNSFIVYIFTHDPWVAFTIPAMIKMIKNTVVVVSFLTGVFSHPALKMNPIDDWFDLFLCILSISWGIIFIWLTEAPRLIRFPVIELQSIFETYGVEVKLDSESETMKAIRSKEFFWVRWKYYLEIVVFQNLPLIPLYLSGPETTVEEEDRQKWLRLDWIQFSLLQLLLVIVAWIINWSQRSERVLLWNGNLRAYNNFYIFWIAIIIAWLGPGLYMFYPPNIMNLIGNIVIFLVLFVFFVWKTAESFTGFSDLLGKFHF